MLSEVAEKKFVLMWYRRCSEPVSQVSVAQSSCSDGKVMP